VDFNLSAKNFPLPQEKIRMGKSADQIFKDRPEILPLLNVTQPEILELRIAGPNGELVLKIKSIPILEGNPAISGVLLLVDDITDEIKTSERLQQQAFELQQLNTLKDKLFGIISHDLKGPVFGVKELIHLTQSGLVSKDEFMGMLPVVSKNLEQVAILLDNLLAWTSTQLRGEFLEYQQVNLENIISNQINLLERIAQEKSISIESEGLENLWVKANKNMMEMVFRNLISNAIKFSKPEQRIFISGERTGNYFKVCVRDSGLGISEENLKKLREGKSFTTRGSNNESGTGLGMILVKEFLLKNNGTLEIDSTLGKGSVFCIQLPALEVEPVD
jgi:signal transduction histidine kinase